MTVSDVYGCLLSAQFDFSTDALSGKWGRSQQAYKLSTRRLAAVNNVESLYPFKIIETKLKIRGSGNVIVLRYESEEGKDFQLNARVTPFTHSLEG